MKSFRLFKTVTLSVLFLILSVCALMFAFNAKTVQATSPVFEMDKGVYVKLVDDGGLRFRVKMDETTKAGIDGEGNELFFLLMSQEKFDAANGDFSNVDCKKIPADKSLIYYSAKDESYYSNLLIYNIPENMRAEYLCVVAGKTVDGVTTFASYESATQVCKTFYNAVNASLVDLGMAEILDVYTWLGTEEYPVFIESEEQFEAFVNLVNSEEIDASVIKSVELKKWIDFEESIFTNENFDASVITCTDESVIIVKDKTEFINALNIIYSATNDEANPVNIKLGADIVFEESAGAIYPAKSSALYGTIDGCGYAIKNLKINTSHGDYAQSGGLFSLIYGEIKNVAFINATVDNGAVWASGAMLCGTLKSTGVISNVFISGKVLIQGNNCGGIVWTNEGTVKNCIVALETNNTTEYCSAGVKVGGASNCYGISSTFKQLSVQQGTKCYENNAAFLSNVTSLPEANGWNSYWKLANGTLYFGKTNVFAKNYDLLNGDYFYDFALTQTADYEIALNDLEGYSVSDALDSLSIGETVISNATLADGVLTVPNSVIVSIGTGDYTMVINLVSGNSYKLKVSIVTSIITLWSDFSIATNNSASSASDYYILGGNIVANATIYGQGRTNAFKGILDGRGHTVSKVTIDSSGYFSSKLIHTLSGTIRNIAFNEFKNNAPTNAGAFALCESLSGGTIDNVYINSTIKGRSGQNSCGIYNYWSGSPSISNCIINVNLSEDSASTTNFIIGGGYATYSLKNCYAITNMTSVSNGGQTFGANLNKFDTSSLFFDGVSTLSAANGWGKYWSITDSGLMFGNVLLIEK